MMLRMLFPFILAGTILPVLAIKCYQCNSKEFPECENLSIQPQKLVAGFYQDCPSTLGPNLFCRKVVITVFHGNVRRVSRSCGWERGNHSCYKADNDDHLETVCQCFTDGCNHSTVLFKFHFAYYLILVLIFKCL